MAIEIATRMRLVAISNTVMVLVGLSIVVSFPLPSVPSVFDLNTFIWLFILTSLDFSINIVFLRGLLHFITADIRVKFRIILISWLLISGINRLLVSAYTSYTVYAPSFPILIPYLIGISSILFGLMLLYIRGTKVAIKVKSRLRVIVIFNFFNSIFFLTPVGMQFTIQGYEIGYLIVLLIAGLIKGLTYLISGWVFFSWSFDLIDFDIPDSQHPVKTVDPLYPEEQDIS